jgi:hypothetical protein
MKRAIIILALIPVILLIAWFSFRNYFLNHFVEKAQIKAESLTNLKVQINNKGFKGFNEVFLDNIVVITTDSDTLFRCKFFTANISLSGYLTGGLPLNELLLQEAELKIADQNDSISRWRFLLKQNKRTSIKQGDSVTKQNYAQLVNRAWDLLQKVSETDARFLNLKLQWTSENYHESLSSDE